MLDPRSPTMGDVLGVGHDKIKLLFFPKSRKNFPHRPSAKLPNYITNKKSLHLCLFLKPRLANHNYLYSPGGNNFAPNALADLAGQLGRLIVSNFRGFD